VVGTVAVLVGLLVVVGALVVWKKGHRSPPRAAVEALERAKAAAEKDSLAALAEAETQATSAIDAARSGFPAAYAELAEIDVAWADALSDEASYWNDRATFASRAGDERARQDADGKASRGKTKPRGGCGRLSRPPSRARGSIPDRRTPRSRSRITTGPPAPGPTWSSS